MDNIIINRSPAKPYFPSINFDYEKGICEIIGESYMEEAYKFYIPLIEWIKEFTENENRKLTLNIKLIYFNTSTTKCLLDIFELMKKYKLKNKKTEINWYYDKDDPDMVDEVKDFEKEADVSINILKI
ncbi:MAG: DUF1987 domain-containing protein [Bacteroidales bacterium]